MRIGMLTPSSNTVLEPATAAMLADLPGVTAHFARLRVVAIDLGDASRAQFEPAALAAAAALLGDARPASICWNGTSGAWLGRDADLALAAAIGAAAGVPATTATLALFDALGLLGVRRLGLVTPYLGGVQAAIVGQFGAAGIEVVAERHLEDPGNFSFAAHDPGVVAALVRAVGAARPEAIAIHCTNFRGWQVAPALEDALGVPVLDSVAVALWGAVRAAGGDAAPLRGWGRVFGLR